jgi:hypothetical protein
MIARFTSSDNDPLNKQPAPDANVKPEQATASAPPQQVQSQPQATTTPTAGKGRDDQWARIIDSNPNVKHAGDWKYIYARASVKDQDYHFNRHKLLQDLSIKTNREVIMREIFNDCVQLPLKYFAMQNAPPAMYHALDTPCLMSCSQPTYFAEFVRSCIDCLNHIILFITSWVPVAPSQKYPYGNVESSAGWN